MFTIKLAKLPIEIDNRYSLLSTYCKDFETTEKPLFRVQVSQEKLENYMKNCGRDMTYDEAEKILMFREICAKTPNYGVFLLHGAVLSYRGKGYIFTAPRAGGKSTHTALWLKNFPKDTKIINGDKPLIKKENGKFIAYSTPWKGKEGFGVNGKVELAGVCFLDKSTQPKVRKITPHEGLEYIKKQTIYPSDKNIHDCFAKGLANFLETVPLIHAQVDTNDTSATMVKNFFLENT